MNSIITILKGCPCNYKSLDQAASHYSYKRTNASCLPRAAQRSAPFAPEVPLHVVGHSRLRSSSYLGDRSDAVGDTRMQRSPPKGQVRCAVRLGSNRGRGDLFSGLRGRRKHRCRFTESLGLGRDRLWKLGWMPLRGWGVKIRTILAEWPDSQVAKNPECGRSEDL